MNRYEILNHNLSSLMKKYQINQKQLAIECDINEMCISKWLRGKSYPTTTSLHKIADYFGVSINTLINEPTKKEDQELESLLSVLSPTEKERVIKFIKYVL